MATNMEEENEEKWKLPADVNSDLFFYLLGFLRDATANKDDKEEKETGVSSYMANFRENNKGINVNIFYCTKLEWNEISPRLPFAVETLNAYPKSKIGKNIRLHVMAEANETVPQGGKDELVLLFVPFETFDVKSVETLKKNRNIAVIPVLERVGSYFGTWLTENKPSKWGGARIKYKIIHPTNFLFEDREKIVETVLGTVFDNMAEDIGYEDEPYGVVGIGDATRIIGFKICAPDALPPSIFQNLVQNLANAYRETFGLEEYERVPYDSYGLTEVAEEVEPSPIVRNLKLRYNLHSSVHGMWTADHGTGMFCFFEEMTLDHGIDPCHTIEDTKWRNLVGLEGWELQLALKYDLIEKNENV